MKPNPNNTQNLLESLIPLTKEFYTQECTEVAKELLGKYIIKKSNKEFFVGRIVETEAYAGVNDEASHSYNGLTNRNKVMFEEGGLLYVYLSYGIHHCANVVTGEKNNGEAVLIRAIEPISGIDKLISNKFKKKRISNRELINLTNGPAKFCQAFNITLKNNRANLITGNIRIASLKTEEKFEILSSPRIGISKSKDLLWRFFIRGNKYVSNRKIENNV